MSTNINRYKPDNDGRLWPAVDGEYVFYSDHISVLSASPASQPAAVKGLSPREEAKLKGDVARLFDGEAWKAMDDGRDRLEGSLWHLRRDWALEKAAAALSIVRSALTVEAETGKEEPDPDACKNQHGEVIDLEEAVDDLLAAFRASPTSPKTIGYRGDLWTILAECLQERRASPSPSVSEMEALRRENGELLEAATNVISSASDTYKKRNGHLASFEDDSGEKCWIVPFDAFEGLRSALSQKGDGK